MLEPQTDPEIICPLLYPQVTQPGVNKEEGYGVTECRLEVDDD